MAAPVADSPGDKIESTIDRIFMRTYLKFLLALAVASCIPPAAAQTATITNSVNLVANGAAQARLRP